MECKVGSVSASIRVYGNAIHNRLEIVKAVDDTVEALCAEQNLLRDFITMASDVIERIANCENHKQIDPDNAIDVVLEASQDSLTALYHNYKSRLHAAHADHQLKGDHEDAVIDEYEKSLELISCLHDVTEELRWAVKEYDADKSESAGSFDKVEDLIKHLRAV